MSYKKVLNLSLWQVFLAQIQFYAFYVPRKFLLYVCHHYLMFLRFAFVPSAVERDVFAFAFPRWSLFFPWQAFVFGRQAKYLIRTVTRLNESLCTSAIWLTVFCHDDDAIITTWAQELLTHSAQRDHVRRQSWVPIYATFLYRFRSFWFTKRVFAVLPVNEWNSIRSFIQQSERKENVNCHFYIIYCQNI